MAEYEEKRTSVKPSGPSRTRPKGFVPSDGSAALARRRVLGNSAISSEKRAEASVKAGLRVYPTSLFRKRNLTISETVERAEWAHVQRERDRSNDKRRGGIGGFSKKSCFRLMQKLGSVGREDPPFKLSLTFRSGAPEAEEAKYCLRKMYQWLGSHYDVAGIWRMEVTTGEGTRAVEPTTHFHVLVWCWDWIGWREELVELGQEIAAHWCKVTKDGGEDRMRYGSLLEPAETHVVKAKQYLTGHMRKKTEQEACGKGRHWGIFNESRLQIGKALETITLTPAQRGAYDRITAKLIASRGKGKSKKRNLASLRETHLVLDPWQQGRLLRYLETITK